MTKYISVKAAAEIADLSMVWIRKMAGQGQIPGAKREGERNRATWYIPENWAQNYKKTKRGRPRKKD